MVQIEDTLIDQLNSMKNAIDDGRTKLLNEFD